MKAVEKKIHPFLNGNKQYKIPVFQRDYSWTKDQCNQMWNDILRASNSGHFMGSIVYVEDDSRSDFQSWLVIDGQQRLTTLTLLLIALRDHIRDTDWVGAEENSPTVDRINSFYLMNEYERENKQFKLVLRRTDDATLRNLIIVNNHFNRVDEPSERIMEAYDFFIDYLQNQGEDLGDIYRGIVGLDFVDVKLERPNDNPQLIFESLNTTGVSLSQSDLVRNYLLMGLEEIEQTRLYNDYWFKIESSFQKFSDIFDVFLRDYVALQTCSVNQVQNDSIYDAFKEFWNPDSDTQLTDLLDDMVRAARNYAEFRGTVPMQDQYLLLSEAMNNMRSLHTTQGTLIMRLYDCHEQGQISNEEFVNAVNLIESYLLRRAVVGLDARSYWSIFARIAHAIDLNNTIESLKVEFARLRDNSHFPSDNQFKRGLQENDLYGLRACKHILDRLENAGHREPSPVGEYSIEHIMPRKIEDDSGWSKMLGADWEVVYETWLHRLGNLTLTAYNSRYSNSSFETKKNIEGGFNQSAVRLNAYVKAKNRWTAEEIKTRCQMLAERGLEIWPHHQADEMRLQEADVNELIERANNFNLEDLGMSNDVRQLLDQILQSIRDFGEVYVLKENKSVCCYGPELFAELLPMAHRARIMLPLNDNEIGNYNGPNIHDASSWRKSVPNRMHSNCNLLVDIYQSSEIERVIPIIRSAFNRP